MELWKSLYLVMVVIPIAIEAASWDYGTGDDGPAKWSTKYPKCGGSVQSPIDYVSSTIEYGQSLGAITLEGYDALKIGSSLNLTNNGHSLSVKVNNHPGVANISGSGLPGMFTLLNVHFHWGNSSTEGSEHKVEGKAFPAEVHFVHYNMKYTNLSVAIEAKDGLAVLSVLLEKDGSDNSALEPILKYAGDVSNKGNTTAIPNFALRGILPSDISKFYRNNGSLTTPKCQESVTWTVFSTTMTISEKQLNILRGLKMADGNPIVKNFRPIQATNNRSIKATFEAPPTTALPTTAPPTTAPPSPTSGSGAQALGAALVTIILCALPSFVLKY